MTKLHIYVIYFRKLHVCKNEFTSGLSSAGVHLHTCVFFHMFKLIFTYIAISFTCHKTHPGADLAYVFNLHTVCKSALVNGFLLEAKQ